MDIKIIIYTMYNHYAIHACMKTSMNRQTHTTIYAYVYITYIKVTNQTTTTKKKREKILQQYIYPPNLTVFPNIRKSFMTDTLTNSLTSGPKHRSFTKVALNPEAVQNEKQIKTACTPILTRNAISRTKTFYKTITLIDFLIYCNIVPREKSAYV